MEHVPRQVEYADAEEGLGGRAGRGVDVHQRAERARVEPDGRGGDRDQPEDDAGALEREAHLFVPLGAVQLAGERLEGGGHAVHDRDARHVREHRRQRDACKATRAQLGLADIVARVGERDDVAENVEEEANYERGGLREEEEPGLETGRVYRQRQRSL